jgi:hypothetical protein
LAAALLTANPLLAALAVCARMMTCTQKVEETGPMGACVWMCPNGKRAYCPCSNDICEVPIDE